MNLRAASAADILYIYLRSHEIMKEALHNPGLHFYALNGFPRSISLYTYAQLMN